VAAGPSPLHIDDFVSKYHSNVRHEYELTVLAMIWLDTILTLPIRLLRTIRVPPLILVWWPQVGAANNCGRPANLSGPRLGATPLKLAGVALTAQRVGSGAIFSCPFRRQLKNSGIITHAEHINETQFRVLVIKSIAGIIDDGRGVA